MSDDLVRCGNCGALIAPGVPFCLVCKQEIDPQEFEPGAEAPASAQETSPGAQPNDDFEWKPVMVLPPAEPEQPAATSTETPAAQAPAESPVENAEKSTKGVREPLPDPVFSRWRDGPTSPPLPVKIILTMVILWLAPFGTFWGFTALMGLIYFPLAILTLHYLWKRHLVDEHARPNKLTALYWVGVVVVLAVMALPFLAQRRHDYPCTEVKSGVYHLRLDPDAYTNYGPAYAVPSGKETGAWLIASNTAKGPAVWAYTGELDDPEGFGYFYTANDAAAEDSIEGGTPYQEDVVQGMQAMRDEAAIQASIDCLAQHPVPPE